MVIALTCISHTVHGSVLPFTLFQFCSKFVLLLWVIKTTCTINNGNKTEWSPISSVMIRVITKPDDRAVGVPFVYHEYDHYKQLLDEVFVITPTKTSIILDITKSESNNCFIIH